MRASRALILLLIALALFQYAHYEPLLPELVPSHFNAAGQPDAWTAKTTFLLTNLIFVIGMAALFTGVTSLVKKLPNAWINMPNKGYWLAPERRDATMDALQRQMEWLGAATLALLVGITQLTIEAAMTAQSLNNRAFWILSGGYFLIVTFWLVRFGLWAYRRSPKPDEAT